MDLAALKSAVLDAMHAKVEADVFSSGQLARAINLAYSEMVSELERVAPAYNVSSATPQLTTAASSPVREYSLATEFSPVATAVRKVTDCVRNYDDRRIDLPIVAFGGRNEQTGRPGSSARVSPHGVYFYRTGGGVWYMGFVSITPLIGTTFEIRYLELITELSAEDDAPTQMPDQWHHLIAWKAAIVAMTAEKRDTSGLAAQYMEGIARMRNDLSGLVSPGRVTPL